MTTALEVGEGSASRLGLYLTPGKTRYPLYRKLGGVQGRSGQVWKISPPPGFEPRTVQTVTSRYTYWANRPSNLRLNFKRIEKISNPSHYGKQYLTPDTRNCYENSILMNAFLTTVQQPPAGQGLLIIEDSRSLSDTPHSVGLLWNNDQSVPETSTWQHTTLTTDRYPCPGGICTHNPNKRVAADPRLRPREHWDRHWKMITYRK